MTDRYFLLRNDNRCILSPYSDCRMTGARYSLERVFYLPDISIYGPQTLCEIDSPTW